MGTVTVVLDSANYQLYLCASLQYYTNSEQDNPYQKASLNTVLYLELSL